MKYIYSIIFTSILIFSFSQKTIQWDFHSNILNTNRKIDISLPKNYDSDSMNYPVIYALDGENLFSVLQGTLTFYSETDKIPACILVAIQQNYQDSLDKNYKRWIDCSYSNKTGMLDETGLKFKSFLTEELIPEVNKKFRTTRFKAIVGHSFTANYVNYFLLDKTPVFDAYISISPYFAEKSLDSLYQSVAELNQNIYYFLSVGDRDNKGHIESAKLFDKRFITQSNPNFHYSFHQTEKGSNATHYTVIPKTIAFAVEHIFSGYSSISQEELKKLVPLKNKVSFLKKRYETIKQVYGLDQKISEDDFYDFAYIISEAKNFEELKLLGELCIETYPNWTIGYYYLGEYYEHQKDLEKALFNFEKGFSLLSSDIVNVEDFKVDITRVKKKISEKKK